MIETLETVRLVLRPIQISDVDELVSLDSDPEVMRFLTGGQPSSPAEVESTIRKRMSSRWMAYERDTRNFVGWFGLIPAGDGEYELGYRLRREFWGRGFATEGSQALLEFAFDVKRATRVFAETMAVNRRSRAVMERCGMKCFRKFHLDWEDPIPGTEHGEVEYAITRQEWLAGRKA